MKAKDLQQQNKYRILDTCDGVLCIKWNDEKIIAKEVIKILYAELDACILQNNLFVQMLYLTDHMQIHI